MNIKLGTKIDDINVTLSYKIIELFSAGLYSSPNKAFEELVCNSYDANADKVGVFLSPDLSVEGAHIWVCDNGESMDQGELKDLWRVGESNKRRDVEKGSQRLQIGRFGIGKLATYILANNLAYICKKDGRYIATNMDYTKISDKNDNLKLDEIELTSIEAKKIIEPLIYKNKKYLMPFKMFGEEAEETWTFSIMTGLKPKAAEIKEGRLKWVLKTALPLNPGFKLSYNGEVLKSSKLKKPLLKKWIIGKDDEIAEKLECKSYQENGKYFIDLDNLEGVHGSFELYEDTLLEGKSSNLGRSHGIFLMVRQRLINLDDPLLGMEAFSHGVFNRTRILIHADSLDENIASTRESIKESIPYQQLKSYIKKKFNNEVKKYYFDKKDQEDKKSSLSYRLSLAPLSISRTPILTFVKKSFQGEIINPWLFKKLECPVEDQEVYLKELEDGLEEEQIFSGEPSWENLPSEDPIAKFDINNRLLRINLMHPFIANCSEQLKSKLPIEFIALTEVLTEAHMYEISMPEDTIHEIMRRRDKILRELVFSDRLSAPVVASMVKDALADPTGLEEAVYKAFSTLGFETKKIGGKGTPDGKADAVLGYSDSDKNENYSLTYDAKSTGKNKIQAGTAKLSAINRHKADYKADYAVVVAIDYEGANDIESAISKEANLEKITVMKAKDLMRLLILASPKQLSLKKLRELFDTCYTPIDVEKWVDEIENSEIDRGPIDEILETIYDLQKEDSEPPELASVRIKMNAILSKPISIHELKNFLDSLKILVPELISIDGNKIGIGSKPKNVKQAIDDITSTIPLDFQKLYIDALCIDEKN